MSTATQTRTAQLLSAQQLREQQEISGREGLTNLLAAVRRMMDWLLLPFRLVARVLFKPNQVVGDMPATDKSSLAARAAGPAIAAVDDVSFNSFAPGETEVKAGGPEFGGLMKQIAENPEGGLNVEVTGKAEDLDAVLPMLMRNIEQILKTHLPSDAQEAHVASHLVALAETAECSRYAHRLVAREVENAMKAVAADPKYLGLSAGTVQNMVRAAAQSPEAAALFGEGSAEQRLLARLAVRDKIEADFSLQMQQMAVALAPLISTAKSTGEMEGRGKELLAIALQAAEATRTKLRVRQLAHGAAKVLPETLPELADAVDKAIGSVASSMNEKLAATTVPEIVGLAGGVSEPAAPAIAGSVEVAPASAASIEVTVPVATPAVVALPADVPAAPVTPVTPVAPATPATPATPVTPAAPATPVTPAARSVKAAARAVQVVRSGGMFGGAAVVSRNAAELEEASVIDDAFVMEEGETLVGG